MSPPQKHKLRAAIEQGLAARKLQPAPQLDEDIIHHLPPSQYRVWKDLLYQYPHLAAFQQRYTNQLLTLTNLIGDYGVILASNIFHRSGYSTHLQGIEFRYPRAAAMLRQRGEQEAYQDILKLNIRNLQTIADISRARSEPDLYIFWDSPYPGEKNACSVEVKMRKNSSAAISLPCFPRYKKHWDFTALLLGVFEFPKKKHYKIMSGAEMERCIQKTKQGWQLNLYRHGHPLEANPFLSRSVPFSEIQHHNEVSLESFLGYLLLQEQEHIKKSSTHQSF